MWARFSPVDIENGMITDEEMMQKHCRNILTSDSSSVISDSIEPAGEMSMNKPLIEVYPKK